MKLSKTIYAGLIAVVMLVGVVGCGGGGSSSGSSGSSSGFAPASLVGKIYTGPGTLNGTGLTTTGSITAVFANGFAALGGVDASGSDGGFGSYTYARNGNAGTATSGTTRIVFTFSSATTGTYAITDSTVSGASITGSFGEVAKAASGSGSALAPTSLVGKAYRGTVTEGSGDLASSGRSVTFFTSATAFIQVAESDSVASAFGTYVYTSSGNIGTFVSTIGNIETTDTATFTSASAGRISSSVTSGGTGVQTSTFVEI